MDLPHVGEFVKAFYNKLFSAEGDIFKNCSIAWISLRSLIIIGLYDSGCKLERYTIMGVLMVILEELADVTASAARMDVQLDWLIEVLGQIAQKKKHVDLLERTQALEEKLYELDRQGDEITQTLAEINAEIVANNLSVEKVTGYPVRVLRDELL